jgi:hypothetical protein
MLSRRITAWLCLSALLACQGRDSSRPDSARDSQTDSMPARSSAADAPPTASTGTWVAAGTSRSGRCTSTARVCASGRRMTRPGSTGLRSTRGSRPIRYVGSARSDVRPSMPASGLRSVATACRTKCGRIPLWWKSTQRAITDVRSLARASHEAGVDKISDKERMLWMRGKRHRQLSRR